MTTSRTPPLDDKPDPYGEPCLICGKPVPDYEPKYCCSGRDCGCQGQPTEPCVCSDRCYRAVMDYIGHEFAERRELAGIELWMSENTYGV